MMKNLSRIFLVASMLTMSVMYANAQTVTADNVTGSEGETVNLAVNLNNGSVPITTMGLDLYLPEGVTPEKDSAGDIVINPSSRKADHIFACSVLADGAYRFLIYSNNNRTFSGTEGVLFTVPIKLDAAPGLYEIQLKNIEVVDPEFTQINPTDFTATLTITEPEVIRYGENQLYVKDLTIQQGEDASLQIGYNSASDVYGYSAEVVLPTGVTVEGVTFGSAVSVKNFANDWSFEAPVLTVSGEQGRKGELALSGDNIIAVASLNTSSLLPGEYNIKVQSQYLSNDDDDYEPATYDAILTVKGSTPTAVELIDGVPYTNSTDINDVDVSYTRNFPAAKWQALYIPFGMNYEDWADFGIVAEYTDIREYDTDGDGVSDKTALVFKHITSGKLKANTPYVFKPYNAGEVRFSSHNTTLYAAPAQDSAIAHSTSTDTYTLYGNYTPIEGLWGQGGYALSAEGAFTHAASESQILNPYRVYLLITKLDGTPNKSPKLFSIIVDDGTSEIEDMEIEVVGDDAIYDIFGRKVEKPASGVYIQNGKKIYIK